MVGIHVALSSKSDIVFNPTSGSQSAMPPSRSSQPRGAPSKCKLCHNLDPRGHSFASYDAEGGGASTTIKIDAFSLARQPAGACRFCQVLVDALDALKMQWQQLREPIRVDLALEQPIRIWVPCSTGERFVEVYSPKGGSP